MPHSTNASPILAIETSCDETAVAIYDHSQRRLLAHTVYSQTAIHRPHGGVVPELASRDHVRKLLPLINGSLQEAAITPADLSGIAYTRGPGLVGALMVGAMMGQTLAYGWGLPSIGVHHLEAHLMAVLLEDDIPSFPFLGLLVSGGHTLLVEVGGVGQYKVVGTTLDDAAGEAFDKTAKRLGLPYPGGPELAKLAEHGNPDRFTFPRPMLHHKNLDFSFSGLKTHCAQCFLSNQTDDEALNQQLSADIACAFQEAVVDVLLQKTRRALQASGFDRLVVAGGVSANTLLRQSFRAAFEEEGKTVYYPKHEYCTDNAAMVAVAGALRLSAGEKDQAIEAVRTRWPLDELLPPRVCA